jgi:hypothetical protein
MSTFGTVAFVNKLVEFINLILSVFRIKIISTHHGDFSMSAALKRASKQQSGILTVFDIGASMGAGAKKHSGTFQSQSFSPLNLLLKERIRWKYSSGKMKILIMNPVWRGTATTLAQH